MTESDYSPAAYERYLHTQNRVSNWVSQTKAHERRYANPFVPSAFGPDQEQPSRPRPQRSKSSGSTSNASSATLRPPQRSKTLDSKDFSRSRSFSSSQDNTTTRSKSQSRSPRHHHSHSHSQSYAYQSPPHHHRAAAYRPPMPDPVRSYTTPAYKTYDTSGRGGPILLPQPRGGETYVIIPPSGHHRVVDSASPTKGSVTYAKSPRPHGHENRHAYAAKEPLLKRILGSIPWSNHGSTRGSGRSPHRRRSSY
jgi:hypothetical protein